MNEQEQNNKPTRGQLEREISQRLQALYREQLGQQPSRMICQLFDDSLVIILEDSITPAERRLAELPEDEGIDLAEQVRESLDKALRPQIRALIADVLGVEVIEILGDATIETGRVGLIAVLGDTPEVRNPQTVPKRNKHDGR